MEKHAPEEPVLIEGAATLCRDKTLNDVILRGKVHGRDCIIKHSCTAVRSIENEYLFCAKLHPMAPLNIPEPVATWRSGDGKGAYCAIEWIEGESLTGLLEAGPLDPGTADAFAADIANIADVLEASGVVHRDVYTDNFIAGGDGHLRLIDWQTAISRERPEEDPWIRRHWKFLYSVFGVNRNLPPGEWNDFDALAAVLGLFPQTETVRAVRESLEKRAPRAAFAMRPSRTVRFLLLLHAANLLLQAAIRRPGPKRESRLRRMRAILGTGRIDIDGRDPAKARAARNAQAAPNMVESDKKQMQEDENAKS